MKSIGTVMASSPRAIDQSISMCAQGGMLYLFCSIETKQKSILVVWTIQFHDPVPLDWSMDSPCHCGCCGYATCCLLALSPL